MGMTIDDCINYYNKSFVIGNTDDDRQHNDILEMTIDTMRKYQKIAEIVFPLQFCSTDKLEHEAIMKICEVLEDENDQRDIQG